jgi:5'-nucleotidase
MSKLVRFWISVLVLLSVTITPAMAAAPQIQAVEAEVAAPGADFDLTILHTNDFHGRVDQYNRNGARCSEADETAGLCIAGSSRLQTLVEEIRAAETNVLLVDAGDQFQGTLFYSLFKADVITDTMNAMGYDAMTIGNHEFDDGPAELARLADGANFPIVSANVDVSAEPLLDGKIAPYAVVNKGGEDIGIVGVTTPEAENISSPGPNVVFDDPVTSVQAAADTLTGMGIDKIVVLSHMGYEEDLALAAAVSDVDVIIGGHSHTFIYTPTAPIYFYDPQYPQYSALAPAGPYPTVVPSLDSEPVLVVTAFQWGTFLGRLDVGFDATGIVTEFGGNPIYLDRDTAKSAAMETILDKYRPALEELINTEVGTTTVDLPILVGGAQICRLGECLMGNLVADAMLWKANEANPGGGYQIAFQNGGGLRAPIMAGPVTMGDVLETLPFGNAIATFELTGTHVIMALENGLSRYPSANGGFAQVAGIKYYFDPAKPVGSRVTNVDVWNGTAYEPLDPNHVYKVVTNDFMRKGGDNYTVFRDYAINPYDFGPALDEALADYFKAFSPVTPQIEGRIVSYPKADKVITILHTNDTHGSWPADTYGGGMARIATLIEQQRAINPNAILLDAGDTFQGNAFAYFFKDRPDNPIAGGMNLMGYDAMTIGNHEFNFGPTTFQTMLSQVNFPLLGSANLDDDGSYGLDQIDLHDYITMTVDGLDIVIYGLTNPRVPRYELPTNIPGLTFHPATVTAISDVPTIINAENPDLFVALTHIGYEPYGGEEDSDRRVAEAVAGIDVIVGGHSHTRLNPAVMITSTVNPEGTLVAHAYRYAGNLGVVNIGFTGNITDGYEIAYRSGYLIPTSTSTPAEADLQAYLDPFLAEIDEYNATPIGQTIVPLDALTAYTEETNAANLQVDAAVWALEQEGVEVDFHLSGAMANRKVADAASATNPVTITKGDMFNLMPYENSLVAFELTGEQLKMILERGYRNYWYYKYGASMTPPYGGLSRYTTCMLDISMGGMINYTDYGSTVLPDGNNVISLFYNDGTPVVFDAAHTYRVSTVNYIAAGSCNFNDDGITIWPLDQIVADTQYYVRDSVIDYVEAQTAPIAPMVEGRLRFTASNLSESTKEVVDADGDGVASAGEILTYTITLINTSEEGAAFWLTDTLPVGVTYVPGSLYHNGFPDSTMITITGGVLTAVTDNFPSTPDGGSFTINMPGIIRFAVMVDDSLPAGNEIVNQIELRDQDDVWYSIAPATIPLARTYIFLPLVMRAYTAP